MKKILAVLLTAITALSCVSFPAFAAETEPAAAAADASALLETPQILSLESSDNGVEMSWRPVEGAELYRVYYKGKNGWTKMGDTTDTFFVDQVVSPGSTYIYTVRCLTADCSAFTSDFNRDGWRFTYGLETPVITTLTSSPEGVYIEWDPVSRAGKYRIYYKGKKGWTKMAETEKTSFLDTDVSFGKTYTYTVRCINPEGNRFASSYNSTGWKHTHYLDTPQITELSGSKDGVTITWAPVEGAERYRVYYKGKKGWTKMEETSGTSYLDTDVSYGSTYTYTVRCVSASGSFTSDFNRDGWKYSYQLDVPQLTGFESIGKGVRLSWDKVDGAVKYRVYYYGSKGWTKMGETADTSFIDDDVKVGTTYRYTIRCINASGSKFTSGYSSTGWKYTYAPKLATPQISTVEAVSGGVQINWKAVDGADLYRVYYKGKKGWTKMADVRGTSYIDTDVSPNHTYTYTVRCLSCKGKDFASDYNHEGTKFTLLAVPKITNIQTKMYGITFDVDANSCRKVRIYRKSGNSGWKRLGEIDNSEKSLVIDTDVEPGKTYTYTARCLSEDGSSFASYYNTKGWSQACTLSSCIPELDYVVYDGSDKALVQPCDGNIFDIDRYILDVLDASDNYLGSFELTNSAGYIQLDAFKAGKKFKFILAGVDGSDNLITSFNENGQTGYMLPMPAEIKVAKTGDRKYRFSWEDTAYGDGYTLSLYAFDPNTNEQWGIDSELIRNNSYEVDFSVYPEDYEWTCFLNKVSADGFSASRSRVLFFEEAEYR